ncbi:MAG: AAA family ATPase [Holophagales bacterium]|nr:AAA family ATPase [Holophagales bacterium]
MNRGPDEPHASSIEPEAAPEPTAPAIEATTGTPAADTAAASAALSSAPGIGVRPGIDPGPYVPGLALRHLALQPKLPEAASAELRNVVAVFADISGFTALTETLAHLGARGAEEVREVLNSCFGPLIDLVIAHGGEVEKFAGDGTLALWPADGEEGLDEALRRAAGFCLEAMAELDHLEVRHDFVLRLRLAITAGPAWLVFVGGVEDRWEAMIIGDAIGQIGDTIPQARPGQVVVSARAWPRLEPWAEGEALDGGCRRLARLADPLEPRPAAAVVGGEGLSRVLTRFVPVSLQSRLDAGQTGWLAEFRRVTVLFASLGRVGFDHGDLPRLQEVVETFQRAVYRFGGSVNQVMTDDKGTCLIAAWGLAFRTYDDNSVRALRAALAVRGKLLAQGVEVRIGVATGQTYSGLRGNRRRVEYALIGDAINLAARLMQTASSGAILCDPYTRAAALGTLDFEALDAVRVKGKSRPVLVFRPLGVRRTRQRRKREILGRDQETGALRDLLEELRVTGRGSTAVVEGEAGIGKSHLLDDLVARVRSLGIRLLQGNGEAIERNRTHYPWRAVFTQLLDLEGLDGRRQITEAVLAAIDPGERQLAPLLSPVLPIPLEDTETTAGMTVQGRAEARLGLMLELLRRATASEPLVVEMEDAHWLDSASWSLLEAAHREVPGLLLVIGTRPLLERDLTLESRRLLEDPEVTYLRLGPLDPEAVHDLVCLRLGAETLPAALADLLLAKAEGHPFFTEELALSLREQGLIRVEGGRCELSEEMGSFGSLSFPDTAQGVVTGRIDTLDPRQQLTLKVASVLGRHFDSGVLGDVHPIADDRAHLPAHLAALAELELIHPVEEDHEQSFRFKHSITHQAAYDLLPFAQRRQLHRSVAEWHESNRGEELTSVFGLLAHHWSQAEVPGKALHYLEQAGLQAERSFAYKEVARSYGKALQLDEERGEDSELDHTFFALSRHRRTSARLARRARWRRTLGYAQANLGQLEEGARELEASLRLLGETVPSSRARLLRGLLYQIGRQAVHRLRPGSIHRQTGEVAECRLEAAKAFARLGSYYYVSGRRLPFMHAMLAALNVAELAPPSPELAMSYGDVCNVAGLIPIHPLARAYVRLALDTARQVDEMATTARVLSRTGIYLTVVGDWQVLPNLERSLALAERLGDPYQWEESAFLLGMARFFQAELAQSESLATGVVDRARRSGTLVHEIWGLGLKADCALHLGDLERCLLEADRLIERIGESEGLYRDNLIRGRGVKALALLRLGRLGEAVAEAERAWQQIEAASRSTHVALQGFVAVIEVALARAEAAGGDGDDPRPHLARARAACAAFDRFVRMMPVARSRALLLESRVVRARGRSGRADSLLEQGLAEARAMALPYDEAKCLLAKGRHQSGDEARHGLGKAVALFEACGATWHLEQARRALADPGSGHEDR